jgi:hypothetical protein
MTLGDLTSIISPESVYETPQKVLPGRDICFAPCFLVYVKYMKPCESVCE